MKTKSFNNTIKFFREYYRYSFRDMDEDAAALEKNPNGFVVLTKDFSIMAKRVNSAHENDWMNLDKVEKNTDAWYIHLAAGPMDKIIKAFSSLPREKYVVFHRGLRDENHAHKLPTDIFFREYDKKK